MSGASEGSSKAAWASACATAFAAVATFLAAYAAYLQKEAQFSSVLYSKQVELVASVNTAMQRQGLMLKHLRDPAHESSEFVTTKDAVDSLLAQLNELNLVLPRDAREHINQTILDVIGLGKALEEDGKSDQRIRASLAENMYLYQQEGRIVSEIKNLDLCGYRLFSFGRYFVNGNLDACYADPSVPKLQ